MSTTAKLMMAAGMIIIGVTAVMRRIMKPTDFDAIGIPRWMIVLVPMLIGVALLLGGLALSKRGSGGGGNAPPT